MDSIAPHEFSHLEAYSMAIAEDDMLVARATAARLPQCLVMLGSEYLWDQAFRQPASRYTGVLGKCQLTNTYQIEAEASFFEY
jgi:hypothetical protein